MTRLPRLGARGEGWVVVQLVLLALVAISGVVTGDAWSGGHAAITSLIGLVLMLGGAMLLGRGILDLGGNLTALPFPRDDASLVVSGVYGLVRHPLYGGLVTTAFGWALVSASVWTLLLSFGLLIFFDLKSRREEVWLRERYSSYPEYAQRTRRLLPWIY